MQKPVSIKVLLPASKTTHTHTPQQSMCINVNILVAAPQCPLLRHPYLIHWDRAVGKALLAELETNLQEHHFKIMGHQFSTPKGPYRGVGEQKWVEVGATVKECGVGYISGKVISCKFAKSSV